MKEVMVKLAAESLPLSMFQSENITIARERDILPSSGTAFLEVRGADAEALTHVLWLNPDSVDFIHIRPAKQKEE